MAYQKRGFIAVTSPRIVFRILVARRAQSPILLVRRPAFRVTFVKKGEGNLWAMPCLGESCATTNCLRRISRRVMWSEAGGAGIAYDTESYPIRYHYVACVCLTSTGGVDSS